MLFLLSMMYMYTIYSTIVYTYYDTILLTPGIKLLCLLI